MSVMPCGSCGQGGVPSLSKQCDVCKPVCVALVATPSHRSRGAPLNLPPDPLCDLPQRDLLAQMVQRSELQAACSCQVGQASDCQGCCSWTSGMGSLVLLLRSLAQTWR